MSSIDNNSQWQRIVIKVGSALIAPDRQGCCSQYLLSIANFIVRCRMRGMEVILVSSGSVAAGAHLFAEEGEPSVTVKKAMAAAGQSEMMATWDRLFDFNTAQLLLTHADLKERARFVSVRDTVDVLLSNKILPIVNENDAVTTNKLRVGDNDNLSAMVASAAKADALIICSDIDGLYTANPNIHSDATLLPDVYEINEKIYNMAGGAVSSVGTGGMKTKIQAAEKAVSHGIDTYIINGFNEQSFNQLLEGVNPGTHFHPHKKPMQDQAHWMRHATKEQGELIVDNGFEMQAGEVSDQLNPNDIIDVNGDFAAGDVVLLRKTNGEKLAKVKSNYGSCLLNYYADQNSADLPLQVDKQNQTIISDKFIAVME